MAVGTLAQFRERFAEFSTTEDSAVSLALEEAGLIHAVRTLAHLYLTAHLIELERLRAAGTPAAGEVSFERAGSLMVQYKTQAEAGGDAFFTSTEYGKHFLTLERRSPRRTIGAIVV